MHKYMDNELLNGIILSFTKILKEIKHIREDINKLLPKKETKTVHINKDKKSVDKVNSQKEKPLITKKISNISKSVNCTLIKKEEEVGDDNFFINIGYE